MRIHLHLGATVVAGGLVVGFLACDDDSASSGAPGGPGIDAGGPLDASSAVDATVDPGKDAGADADGGKTSNALFAHINHTLVAVDPDTGAFTDIGDTGVGPGALAMAWDRVAKVTRIIQGPHSPIGEASTPKLGTIDLCTGVVTDGPAITVGGTQVRRAEALGQDPATGIFYISVGTNGDSIATQFQTEKTGTLDVTTGAVTVIGTHTTLQNDGDALTFVGSTFKLLDLATATDGGALYTIDKTNGTASSAVTTGPLMMRLAYDETRDVVFTAAGTGADPNATARSIGKLNLTTGANTPLGAPLADGLYGGANIYAVLSAPPPACP